MRSAKYIGRGGCVAVALSFVTAAACAAQEKAPPQRLDPPALGRSIDLKTAQAELDDLLGESGAVAEARRALPGLEHFLRKYEGADLERVGYARPIYLYLHGDYLAAVRDLERYFQRFRAIPTPSHAQIAGGIYLNAIHEEATHTKPDLARVRTFALRALDLRTAPQAVGMAVQRALVNRTGSDQASLRMAVVRRILADETLDDGARDLALRHLFGGGSDADAAGRTPTDPLIGKPLTLAFDDLRGRRIDLNAMRGRVVVLHFWTSWCPVTAAQYQEIGQTWMRYHTQGLDMVGVNLDEQLPGDEVGAEARRLGFTWSQAHIAEGTDGWLPRQLGVDSVPTFLVIDKHGYVRDRVRLAGELTLCVAELLP